MKAAVFHDRGDIRIERVPEPEQLGPDEVLLEVSHAAICGSDVSEYLHGPLLIPLRQKHPASGHVGPVIMGHEFTGRVAASGTGVTAFQLGQRLVPGAGIWCGRCAWCRGGRPNLCRQYFTVGFHANGGLAEFAKIPARICREVPAACRDEFAAMAQPLCIALHAVRRSGLVQGQSVAIIGVGAIGILILAAARAKGIGPIIALDIDDERLKTAASLGATHVVNTRRQDAAAVVSDLTSGEGVHVAIEATGSAGALELAMGAVRRGGRLLLVGLHAERRPVDLHQLVMREIDVVTSVAHVCDVDLPEALEILARSDLGSQILDRVIPLEALVPDGILALAEGRAHGKVVVQVGGQ